jgi:cell division inhibitor SepF
VNLEDTPSEVAERLIDFLNGVTYALDGYVEKVAEGAYLFTPAHIAIHAEGPEPPQPKPFFDRL